MAVITLGCACLRCSIDQKVDGSLLHNYIDSRKERFSAKNDLEWRGYRPWKYAWMQLKEIMQLHYFQKDPFGKAKVVRGRIKS